MTNTQIKKKRTKKTKHKMTPLGKIGIVALLAVSVFFVYSVVKDVMTTIGLQQQLGEVQAKLQEVQDENTYLTTQKEKLQDPDYVESYARGNYQLSKDGEQIFYLPENNN